MYAVIKAGGKQQRVKPGDVIEVERMADADGGTVTFQPVLVVDDDGKAHVGKGVERAVVTATPVGEQKGDKIRVFKYRPKSGYSRRRGHRQLMTLLQIEDVKLTGARRPTTKAAEASTAEAAGVPEEEPAKAAEASTKPKATAKAKAKAQAGSKPAAKRKPAVGGSKAGGSRSAKTKASEEDRSG